MKQLIIVLLVCISTTTYSQNFLNLDFEYENQGTNLPQRWQTQGENYKFRLDDVQKFSFSKSLCIESISKKENQAGILLGSFPVDLVNGKTIEFKGKIKTDSVKGFAGLWWRVDGKNGILSFDNMANRGIVGTNSWQEASIKMVVDSNATKILYGGLLVGEGKAWFDNFEIYIDGVKFTDIKPRITPPTDAEIDWLKQRIYPINTSNPELIIDKDLSIFRKLVGNSKVVALGEVSHGSSEIFQMKHRIIKYLAKNDNFNIFSIEGNMPEAYKLNDYIIDGKGDPTKLIKGMYFWTWQTQEFLDMVNWMKSYNNGVEKIQFTGFDMQQFTGAINELDEAFKENKETSNLLTGLRNKLETIQIASQKALKLVVSSEDNISILMSIDSINHFIDKSTYKLETKKWLTQNTEMIKQFIDLSLTSRDKNMSENLLWIKSNNPKSKIMIWAHNSHIKKTGDSMGKYLSDSLKSDYLSIGFAFFKGKYTAKGSNGLSCYDAEVAKNESYESFFNAINEPIFILDLRKIKEDKSAESKWLRDYMEFRAIGSIKGGHEFVYTNLTNDFDMILFINESSCSKLLK